MYYSGSGCCTGDLRAGTLAIPAFTNRLRRYSERALPARSASRICTSRSDNFTDTVSVCALDPNRGRAIDQKVHQYPTRNQSTKTPGHSPPHTTPSSAPLRGRGWGAPGVGRCDGGHTVRALPS